MIKQSSTRNSCSAITISGGEPFEQCDDLLILLSDIRNEFQDILLYTGYTYNEILKNDEMKKCLKYIDVLIDGPYIREYNTQETVLRGSYNQKIIFFNEIIKKQYIDYLKKGRKTECFVHFNNIISIGIHGRKLLDE